MLSEAWTQANVVAETVKLLLVVPDPAVAQRLQDLIGDANCTVNIVTGGGDEARRALRHMKPDVAICHVDLLGRDRNGLVAFERQAGTLTPIIALAPPGREAQAVDAVNAGALTCITLPATPSQLRAALARALELRRMMVAARSADAARGQDDAAQRTAAVQFQEAVDQLYMAWQPLVDATAGTVYGYEALVRSRASCCPSAWHVLDLASRLGRQDDLERGIISHVADDIAAGGLDGIVTVNLSLAQVLREEHAMESHPLRRYASRVVLEVNENGRIEDVDKVAVAAAHLRACGYRIAVDDLGSGFDYLARLLALEPEFFKLDRLALADCDTDARKRRYVGAVVKLAREEGATVVAEGIERPEEAVLAAELGCDLLQGYLLGRPQPREYWVEHNKTVAPDSWLDPVRKGLPAQLPTRSAGAA
ncbi:MAG: EAL domain-containing protein [Oligoflexia bacterium]|nr:EAL domain-containing protein [Oligoflexia bacterium]